jgi:hypothetical protein
MSKVGRKYEANSNAYNIVMECSSNKPDKNKSSKRLIAVSSFLWMKCKREGGFLHLGSILRLMQKKMSLLARLACHPQCTQSSKKGKLITSGSLRSDKARMMIISAMLAFLDVQKRDSGP